MGGGEGLLSGQLTACIEWLFAEGGRSIPDRVRAAAAAGFSQIEFWGAGDKNVGELEEAINETGVSVTAFVSEPPARLVDPTTHADFLLGVERSSRLASRLHARNLIVLSGDALPGVERKRQRESVTRALASAAPIASQAGVNLLLEPLNTRVDHPGYFLDSTSEGFEAIREVNHPAVRLLYDMYHSVVMGEDPARVLSGSGALVGHVHVADVPGRREPGTGTIDWLRELSALRLSGYDGTVGLEYRPTRDTESSLAFFRGLIAVWNEDRVDAVTGTDGWLRS